MSSVDVVWHVKLDGELKAIFEKKAEEIGDTERGAGARQVRKFLKKHLKEDAST